MNILRKTAHLKVNWITKAKRAVGCMWMFTIKLGSVIQRYKAHNICKMYIQTYGLNFPNILAPTTKSVQFEFKFRSLQQGWPISSAWCDHCDLVKKVYIAAPLGLWFKESVVCQLKLPVYGQKEIHVEYNFRILVKHGKGITGHF